MNYNWFLIFNLTEFLEDDLTSRTVTALLEGIGVKNILITNGNEVAITYEDVFMPIGFEDANPFSREGEDATYAVYKDADENVWLGVEA